VEQRDKASISVLENLLMRRDVQDALAEKARGWLPQLTGGAKLGEADCRTAICAAVGSYETYVKSTSCQDALSRLRLFGRADWLIIYSMTCRPTFPASMISTF
jgi:hypothetical protein